MQNVSFAEIGSKLQEIRRVDHPTAPPFHVVTERHDSLTFLGINFYWEFIPQGKESPSLVLVIAIHRKGTGGPYLLYWEEAEDPENQERITQWMRNYPVILLQKIVSMGIGNTL